MAQIEDDVVADLAKVGVTVNTRFLSKEDFNAAMQQGDFNLCFTESWGPPYDPQSFATGWFRPENEAHYAAMQQMEPPMTMSQMETLVTDVLSVESAVERQEKWTEILLEMHSQAISNPMWSRRVPAIWNKRLQGYISGAQQYDYPMHNFIVDSGSTTVKVAPGAQTGLFTATGPMDPHSYRPNEFFISNWIYEGLVSYGHNGVIEPQLATAWEVSDTSSGGQKYRFTLRTGVQFHDGTSFDCSAVKMNFDHVLQPPLNHNWYHGWYHLALHTIGWACDGEVFEVTLDAPYYPFLQELSLIRPLRMLSPEAFFNGPTTDPITHNSCPTKWGHINGDGGMVDVGVDASVTVNCVGARNVAGTGPWVLAGETTRADGSIEEVTFTRNTAWWGQHGGVEELRVVNYDTSDAIKQALIDGDLDVVVGDKVLTPEQVQTFQNDHSETHTTILGPRLFNQIIVMNAAKAPTNDIEVRRLIMHSVDKAAIVQKEMYGQAAVADSLFPRDAPYCDVDLTPRWDYDFEKATLMNCPDILLSDEDEVDEALVLGLSLGIGLPVLAGIAGAVCFKVGMNRGYKKFGEENDQRVRAGPPAVVGSPSAADAAAKNDNTVESGNPESGM
jgi:ABC-type transport system substrate-binding protein